MKITVERFTSDDDTTLSLILVDGGFVCFGLEDEYQEHKVVGETRIPEGEYNIGIRNVGGFHARYCKRFQGLHQGMLQVLDVPNFQYVLIHVGNDHTNTEGCLLAGVLAQSRGGDMSVGSSVEAYKKLYRAVIEAALDDDLTIEYIDRDF